MNNKPIPIYSSGEWVGGLFLTRDGGDSIVRLDKPGTERCAAVIDNDMGYILDLVPTPKTDAQHKHDFLADRLDKDELLRARATELTAQIIESIPSGVRVDIKTVLNLTESIAYFLKHGAYPR